MPRFKMRYVMLGLLLSATTTPLRAETGFPFGTEMTLDAAPQRGSKRIPTLDIGDSGQAVLDFWCKSGKGQFSVANDTVIFVPGAMTDRGCSTAQAQADDVLLATLSDAVTWKRHGDFVSFVGAKTLRFRINTN